MSSLRQLARAVFSAIKRDSAEIGLAVNVGNFEYILSAAVGRGCFSLNLNLE